MRDLSSGLVTREQLPSASVLPRIRLESVGSKMSAVVSSYNFSAATTNIEDPFASLTFHVRALLATAFGITIYTLSLHSIQYLMPD